MKSPGLAVSVVIAQEGRVLLVRRSQEPNRGRWAFPGGRVEWGEALADAAVREAWEECGLAVEIVRLLAVREVVEAAPKPAWHWVVLCYRARPVGGSLAPGGDAEEARWVSPEDLGRLDIVEGIAPLVLEALEETKGDAGSGVAGSLPGPS
jgi:acetyl-CoA carboxylase carboxyl transferase subunit beta